MVCVRQLAGGETVSRQSAGRESRAVPRAPPSAGTLRWARRARDRVDRSPRTTGAAATFASCVGLGRFWNPRVLGQGRVSLRLRQVLTDATRCPVRFPTRPSNSRCLSPSAAARKLTQAGARIFCRPDVSTPSPLRLPRTRRLGSASSPSHSPRENQTRGAGLTPNLVRRALSAEARG